MSLVLTDVPVEKYERVVKVTDEDIGLCGYIAVHNTLLGPALGGIRFRSYKDDAAMLEDVCGLALAMTKKNSLAGLSYGGGKAVILSQPQREGTDRVALYKGMGSAIQQLDGLYFCAEDFGTTREDLENALSNTEYGCGLEADSGHATALGLMAAFAAYCEFEDLFLQEIRVNVAGLGKVGSPLVKFLLDYGVEVSHLLVAEPVDVTRQALEGELGITLPFIAEEVILEQPGEIFSPCAVGGCINEMTRTQLNVNAIIGSANNQLDSFETARWLHKRGITYLPDYLCNAGGVIALAAELAGTLGTLEDQLLGIAERTLVILHESHETGHIPLTIADDFALGRLEEGK